MSNELEGRDLLTGVIDMYDQRRPTKWISRSTGLKVADVRTILRVAGLKPRDVNEPTLEKYDRIEYLVQEGVSHTEIAKTLHCDHRTITYWFPGTQWRVGGWAGEGGLMRELHRQEREFYRSGRIQTNRDSGFNLRRDQA